MMTRGKIRPGTEICCPECRAIQGECVLTPIMGGCVEVLVDACFKGFTSKDAAVCKDCQIGVFYKPKLGFFTFKHGWTW